METIRYSIANRQWLIPTYSQQSNQPRCRHCKSGKYMKRVEVKTRRYNMVKTTFRTDLKSEPDLHVLGSSCVNILALFGHFGGMREDLYSTWSVEARQKECRIERKEEIGTGGWYGKQLRPLHSQRLGVELRPRHYSGIYQETSI